MTANGQDCEISARSNDNNGQFGTQVISCILELIKKYDWVVIKFELLIYIKQYAGQNAYK